ncbi:MAG TPA: hypothetical protein VN580_03280, partial [Clostridia bacterium]|nr:hypothetical protein [Clostridia bacterium]
RNKNLIGGGVAQYKKNAKYSGEHCSPLQSWCFRSVGADSVRLLHFAFFLQLRNVPSEFIELARPEKFTYAFIQG